MAKRFGLLADMSTTSLIERLGAGTRRSYFLALNGGVRIFMDLID